MCSKNKRFSFIYILVFGGLSLGCFSSCQKAIEEPTPIVENPLDVSTKSGMTAFYSFDGNWQDVSGNQHHAISQAGNLVVDRNGKANSALGFSDSDKTPAIFPGSMMKKGATYCFWVNKSDPLKQFSIWNNTYTRPEKTAGVTKDATYGIKIYTLGIDNNYTIEYKVGFSPGIFIKMPYTPNQWDFFTVSVIEGTTSYPFPTFKVYRNGMLIYKQDVDPTAINAPEVSETLKLGGDPQIYSTKAIEGKIDDIGIWSRLLTDDEIVRLFLKK
ncbi:LamG-like jellyroll fold domain-containing protein [Aquirufa ecclesiirivi]|uniref:LamG-like jellyroll fold domain-containing protein n=1 Tax=Aquirufa ecclesiirivi TaxID=2715124 RepID=UPI003BAF0390